VGGHESDPDFHNLGVVPVVPMVNRDRATRKTAAFIEGISEMADVIPIAESASRAVTNGQLAQETHAVRTGCCWVRRSRTFVRGREAVADVGVRCVHVGAMTAMANPAAKATQFDRRT
jgi:hypothetical protein